MKEPTFDYLSIENIIKRHKRWHRQWIKKQISKYNHWYYVNIEKDKRKMK